jgi:hypothetical protein
MLGFVLAHHPWKAISNLKLRWPYNELRSNPVLLSTSTLCNTCQKESSLTLDIIKKKLPSRNKVILALDRWTSTNKLVKTSTIAHFMDRNWALRAVPLVFNDVDYHFFFYYHS